MLTKYQMGVPMEGWNDCPEIPDATTGARKVSGSRKKRPQRVGHEFGSSTPTPTGTPTPDMMPRSAPVSRSVSAGGARTPLSTQDGPPTPLATPLPTGSVSRVTPPPPPPPSLAATTTSLASPAPRAPIPTPSFPQIIPSHTPTSPPADSRSS